MTCLLVKILHRSDCPLTELYLIEYDERIAPGNGLSADMGEDWEKIGRTDVLVKSCSKRLTGLEIKISHIIVMLPSKFQYCVGFPDLTCSLDDQGLSVFAVLPLLQIFRDLSVHIHGDPSSNGNQCRYIIQQVGI